MYAPSYIWAKVLYHMEEQFSEVFVRTWMDDAEVIALTDDTLVIYSPSELRRRTIREQCRPAIEEILIKLLDRPVRLEVWDDTQLRDSKSHSSDSDHSLCPQFTFENYISGASNQLAARIAAATAENPGEYLYNPLFLYGPPGVGKTHLLYAIANHVRRNMPDKSIVYVRADQFVTELITSIQTGNTSSFRKKYRETDVLLVDDIQFVAGKEATQEEFFYTFNVLYEHGKQIVLAADRRPVEMVTLNDRLRDRFGAGIMIAIDPPDPNTRCTITRCKAKEYGLELDEEIIGFLTENLPENVRQIEGALKKIRAFRDLSGMSLTLDNIRATVADICSESSNVTVTADRIIQKVCRYYGIDEALMKGPQKSKRAALPRQVAMYLMRKLMASSFPEIAACFSRDNATVQYAIKKICASLERKDSELAAAIEEITSNIENRNS